MQERVKGIHYALKFSAWTSRFAVVGLGSSHRYLQLDIWQRKGDLVNKRKELANFDASTSVFCWNASLGSGLEPIVDVERQRRLGFGGQR